MSTTHFFVGGCAGSCSPASLFTKRTKFGSHTTSFGLRIDDIGIFVDNGSGIVNVNEWFKGVKLQEVYGFQTHMHFDHRSGLTMNQLLFKKDLVKKIFAPKLNGTSFKEFWQRDFDPSNWPVSPASFGIDHEIEEFAPGEKLEVLLGVETLRLNHPGGFKPGSSVAYKFKTPCATIIIATDTELSEEKDREAYARFVSGATILYVDLQYCEDEYHGFSGICGGPPMTRKGWGHSTPEMLKSALEKCETIPQTVLCGHHDPQRSDEDLVQFEREVWTLLAPLGCNVRFARECDEFSYRGC